MLNFEFYPVRNCLLMKLKLTTTIHMVIVVFLPMA